MIKNILFDFDGVILDSMEIRDYGFRKVLEKYDKNKNIEEFIKFHRTNGGLSRFYKIKYFFNNYLNKEITENEIYLLADEFSKIMREKLTCKNYLITETIQFIKNNYKKYDMYIVSGSEQNELRYLCKELGIDNYFKLILGSPIHKNDLVREVLVQENKKTNETILIGDSINDYEAAIINNIEFYGFNNLEMKNNSKKYIEKYSDLF